MTSELVSGYTYHMMMELVEVDMETGEEILVSTGSLRKVTRDRDESLEEASEDYEDGRYEWPTYRIQPAQ